MFVIEAKIDLPTTLRTSLSVPIVSYFLDEGYTHIEKLSLRLLAACVPLQWLRGQWRRGSVDPFAHVLTSVTRRAHGALTSQC